MSEFNIKVTPTGDDGGNGKKKRTSPKSSQERIDDSKVNKEVDNFLREIEESYKKGTKQIPSGEILKFLEASGVKLGKSVLREVLEKGGVWVSGKEGLKGTAVQNLRYDNDRDDPGKKRRDVIRQLRQKMDKAFANNASLLVDAISKEIDTSAKTTASAKASKSKSPTPKFTDEGSLETLGGGMLRGISENLHRQLWESYSKGSTVMAGVDDPALIAAKKFGIPTNDRQALEDFIKNVYAKGLHKQQPAPEPVEETTQKKPTVKPKSKKKVEQEAAREAIVEQIVSDATSLLDDIASQVEAVASTGGPGKGGGGGKKGTGGGGDGEGGDSGGDTPDGYDPNDPRSIDRYFKARVENLQRTLKTRTFGEEKSIIFSALQGMYEKASRVEDIQTLKSIVNSATRSQIKTLKTFATDIENQTNLLVAVAENELEKEARKEEPNKEVLNFYENRLAELEEVRNKTAKVYSDSKQRIIVGMRDEAKKGYAAGESERLNKELERIRKDDDKIVEDYQKQYAKYMEDQYKKFAATRAEASAKSFIEENVGTMSKRKLMAKAGEIFDTEVSSLMAKMDIESVAGRLPILKASYQQGGEFVKKNFLNDYVAKYGRDDFFNEVLMKDYQKEPILKPTKGGLSKFLPDDENKDQFHKNISRFIQIQEAMGPIVAATSDKGVTGSQALGGVAKAAYATNTPQGMIVGAVVQATGYLAEIAENTGERIQAFAPEVLQAKLENKLDMLTRTIKTGQGSGSDFARYQRSSNVLNAQLFELGVQFYTSFGRGMELLLDTLSFIVVLVRALVLGLGIIATPINIISGYVSWGFRKIVERIDALYNMFTGKNQVAVPDYTDELLKNRPQGL